MGKKKKSVKNRRNSRPLLSTPEQCLKGSALSEPDEDRYLDQVQLDQLEQSFREWMASALRSDVRESRQRILLIFLVIRYTGAKLNEVLNIDHERDIGDENRFVILGRREGESSHCKRKVQISEKVCHELRSLIGDLSSRNDSCKIFRMDPGFVRRKFYERAEACGISKQLGAPEILRKSRAIELMQNNLPFPAVQALMGHATPVQIAAYLSFSEDDIQQMTRLIVEKESCRKTSARNSFFGKIRRVHQGDIQSRVDIATIGGHTVTAVITNDSFRRLGLKTGKIITAEVKAPFVMLHKTGHGERCSADNMFKGVIDRITRGDISTEYVVRISEEILICSIVSSESSCRLSLVEGDEAWAIFSSYSVVLFAD